MSELLLETSPLPGVRLLTLNRPEARNALNLELRSAIATAIDRTASDDGVRAVVITGGPSIFAAGADLKAIAKSTPLDMMESGLHQVWQTLAKFQKPVITAVRGPALGAGSELAMHGDLIVAGESALFGQPEIRVGVMPGAGGVQRLVRLIGRTRAMRLLLTGETIPARTAFEWGLISDLVPDDEVLDRALAYASKIAAAPSLAVREIKAVALAGEDLPLDAALALERRSFWLLFGTPDQREGMSAFLEKRDAKFNQG